MVSLSIYKIAHLMLAYNIKINFSRRARLIARDDIKISVEEQD